MPESPRWAGRIQRAPSWTHTRPSSPGAGPAEPLLCQVTVPRGLAAAPGQYRSWGHLRTTGSPSTWRLVLKCLPRSWQLPAAAGGRERCQAWWVSPDGAPEGTAPPGSEAPSGPSHPLVIMVSKLSNGNFRFALHSDFVGKVKSGSQKIMMKMIARLFAWPLLVIKVAPR